MWYLDISDLFHALLTALLLLKKLALTRRITTIALGRNVLAHLLHCLASHDLGANSRLNGNIELLSGNEFLEFLAHPTPQRNGIILMRKCRQGVHRLTIQENIELCEL